VTVKKENWKAEKKEFVLNRNEFKKIEILFNEIKDRSGNILSPGKITYTVDMEHPTVEIVSGFALNADVRNNVLKLKYSKEVIGADDLLNYKFSTKGIDITEIKELGNNEYDLIIEIADEAKIENGDNVELIISDHIVDLANNILIYKVQKLSIIKTKASDVILILDIAALTNNRVPHSIDHNTGSTQYSRLISQDLLIEKIIFSFLKLWRASLVTDDRIGVILIGKGTDSGLHTSYKNLVYIDDITHKGINNVSQMAWNSRDIKAGIKHAYDILKLNSEPNRDQSILLVTANACLYPEIANLSRERIPLYTAGIGDSLSLKGPESFVNMYEGSYLSGQSLWQDLPLFLSTHLTSIKKTHAIQLIYYHEDIMRGGKANIKREQFRTSTSTKNLTILVSWLGNEPLKLKLDKKNQTICSIRNKSKGLNYYIINIIFSSKHDENDLPFNERTSYTERKKKLGVTNKKADKEPDYLRIIDHDSINRNNSWSIQIEREAKQNKNDIPYQITILAQDPVIAYEIKDLDKPVKTGDRIKSRVNVFENGKPARMNYSVDGVISSPEYEKNRIFYEYFTSDNSIEHVKEKASKGLSAANRNKLHTKLLNILQDEKTVIEQTRRLRKEDSKFTKLNISSKSTTGIGSLSHTITIPGLYRIDYHIKGSTDNYGFYERFCCKTINAGLEANKKNTEVFADYITKTRQILLTIIPKDKYGNHLGPDKPDSITGKICGKDIKEIVDNLDGSYLIVVRIAKKQDIKNRKSSISVFNVKVYDGPTSKLFSAPLMENTEKNRLN
jgi:hypothetical protein